MNNEDLIARLRGALTELTTVASRAVSLSLKYDDFKLWAMDPMKSAITDADAALADTAPQSSVVDDKIGADAVAKAAHPTCATCQHYTPPSDDGWQGAAQRGKGDCNLIPLSSYTSKWSDDGEDVLKPEYADLLAFVSDASGYSATLNPAPAFYCPMHSALRALGGDQS